MGKIPIPEKLNKERNTEMYLTYYKEKCKTDKSVKSLISGYILRQAVRCGGYSVDLNFTAEQMAALRKSFGVTLKEKVVYCMVTFFEYESARLTVDDVVKIAQEICDEYNDDFQIVYGVHYYGLRWFIHIALNPVNMHTGEVLVMDACEIGMFEAYVLHHSGFNKIKTYIE